MSDKHQLAVKYAESIAGKITTLDVLTDLFERAIDEAEGTMSDSLWELAACGRHADRYGEENWGWDITCRHCQRNYTNLSEHAAAEVSRATEGLQAEILKRGNQCAVSITGFPEDANIADIKTALAAIDAALQLGIERNNERNQLQAECERLREKLQFLSLHARMLLNKLEEHKDHRHLEEGALWQAVKMIDAALSEPAPAKPPCWFMNHEESLKPEIQVCPFCNKPRSEWEPAPKEKP